MGMLDSQIFNSLLNISNALTFQDNDSLKLSLDFDQRKPGNKMNLDTQQLEDFEEELNKYPEPAISAYEILVFKKDPKLLAPDKLNDGLLEKLKFEQIYGSSNFAAYFGEKTKKHFKSNPKNELFIEIKSLVAEAIRINLSAHKDIELYENIIDSGAKEINVASPFVIYSLKNPSKEVLEYPIIAQFDPMFTLKLEILDTVKNADEIDELTTRVNRNQFMGDDFKSQEKPFKILSSNYFFLENKAPENSIKIHSKVAKLLALTKKVNKYLEQSNGNSKENLFSLGKYLRNSEIRCQIKKEATEAESKKEKMCRDQSLTKNHLGNPKYIITPTFARECHYNFESRLIAYQCVATLFRTECNFKRSLNQIRRFTSQVSFENYQNTCGIHNIGKCNEGCEQCRVYLYNLTALFLIELKKAVNSGNVYRKEYLCSIYMQMTAGFIEEHHIKFKHGLKHSFDVFFSEMKDSFDKKQKEREDGTSETDGDIDSEVSEEHSSGDTTDDSDNKKGPSYIKYGVVIALVIISGAVLFFIF